MQRWIVVLAMAACGHGETPTTGDISARASCSRDSDVVELAATVDVGLENDQAIRVTFLPAVDGIQFSRTTTWSCGAWSELGVDRGCARGLDQPEIRQMVSVTERNTVNIGTLPSSFEFAMVAAITEVVSPTIDIENVIVTGVCH